MKSIQLLFLSIIGILIITSCSTHRNVHIPGYKTSNKVEKSNSKKYVSSRNSQKAKSNNYKTSSSENRSKLKNYEPTLSASIDNNYSSISTSKKKNNNYQNEETDNECDNIILRSGKEIKAKVIEVTEKTIKYKKCDNLNGPIYSESKSNIFMVQYANGTKDVFKEDKEDTVQENKSESASAPSEDSQVKSKYMPERKTDPVSAFSFIAAMIALIFIILGMVFNWMIFLAISLILLIAAIILGAIGIRRTKKYRDKYKGMGLAIAGLAIGAFFTLVVSLSLLVLMTL